MKDFLTSSIFPAPYIAVEDPSFTRIEFRVLQTLINDATGTQYRIAINVEKTSVLQDGLIIMSKFQGLERA